MPFWMMRRAVSEMSPWITWLVTGPVAWGPVAEVRLAGEAREAWRSTVSAGAGHRWRLLAPFGADLLLTFQTGRHLAPRPDGRAAAFSDLRLEAATFVEF